MWSVWKEEVQEWFFSVVDVVAVLTGSADPKQYIKKMRARDSGLAALSNEEIYERAVAALMQGIDESGKYISRETILNNSVLEINENLNLQMKLSIKWNESSKENSMDIIRPVTICKKSAIVWNDTAMLSCFILPNDKTVTDFAIRSIRNKEKIISKELANGIYICNSVGSLPISYIADPKTPVVENLQNKYAIDTVRFPFETLEFKGGDCDDLTTLLCSLMESCGIQTALITTPGHIFVAFNTKMTYSKTWENLSEEYGVLDVDGTVWIPIEVTAVGKRFLEA